jgi:hypothetical protein
LGRRIICLIADLPVGNRLQDQPFFFNVYALKREANEMKTGLRRNRLDALAERGTW